jgi:hypothetical protein
MDSPELKTTIELCSRELYGDPFALASFYGANGICTTSKETERETARVLADAVLGQGAFDTAASGGGFPALLKQILTKRQTNT